MVGMLKGRFISSSHQCVPVIVAPAFSWEGETGSRGETENTKHLRGYRYKKQCCGKMCSEKTACSPSFFPAFPQGPPRFPVQQQLMWVPLKAQGTSKQDFPFLPKVTCCKSWLALFGLYQQTKVWVGCSDLTPSNQPTLNWTNTFWQKNLPV